MNYLLDTHTLIWFINGDAFLSQRARKLIEHKDATSFVSMASIWEITIKMSLEKLKLNTPLEDVPKQLNKNGFQVLAITFNDLLKLSTLPFHHRDRLIVAQCLCNNLQVTSKDQQLMSYGVTTLW